MYLVPTKTAIVEAFRTVYDNEYPVPELRGIPVSIEFPVNQSGMPMYWVNYDDTDELSIVGIGHEEITVQGETFSRHTRWRFAGTVTITAVAMTSRERDTLYDELVRVLAFGRYTQATSQFREKIENNDLIAISVNFDSLRPSGDNAALGTPWQSQEMIYEKSLSFDLIGEFVGDPLVMGLVPLGEIRTYPYVQDRETAPNPPADPGYEAGGWM
jgi:hypothetical protein